LLLRYLKKIFYNSVAELRVNTKARDLRLCPHSDTFTFVVLNIPIKI
jgi:hypothetical protein